MARIHALALAGALAGAIIVSPASAAPLGAGVSTANLEIGVPLHSRFDPASMNAAWGCGWGGWGCGWGGGWGGGWGRGWRRGGIGVGDVLIGAAVIGGLAAIISSNNRRERDRDVVIVDQDRNWRERDWQRDRDWQTQNDRREDRRGAARGDRASGLDSAVDACLTRIERDVRVDTVDNVDRTGAGWVVSGRLFNGSPFQCRIDNGGRIDGIDYGREFSAGNIDAGQREGQWSDDRYAAARQARATGEQAAPAAGAQAPAYPGGPIPGEVIPETVDEAI